MGETDLELVFAEVATQQFAQPRVIVDHQYFLGSGIHLVMITGPLATHTRPGTLTDCYMVAPGLAASGARGRLKCSHVPGLLSG